MSLFSFVAANGREIARLTLEHLLLVALATGAATAVAIPTGIALTRRGSLERPVLALANVLQTVPSLALFGLLIPLLGSYGIGRVPAVIALFLYSLLPIVRNTFTGIRDVDPAVREAARGMGMTDGQLLRQVELPLGSAVILAGVRTATVIGVGTATIAAAIGAGGLGTYIFRGLRMNDDGLLLAGAVPAALMALAADRLLGQLEKALAPGPSRAKRLRACAVAAATVAALVALLAVWAFGAPATAAVPQVGTPAPQAASERYVVGSKDFTEQVILGELVAQSLERAGLTVARRFELGGDLCHRALVSGELDVYVEYTGTALTAILKEPPSNDPPAVAAAVRRAYTERFGATWLEPFGFDNTFAVLVRGAEARRLGLRRISDAVPHARGWLAGFGQDFMSREDGYPGLARAYGLSFRAPPREMDLSLTYRALASGQVDVIAGNSTDGLIVELDLVQLVDDRRYFPPYEAAAVLRGRSAERDRRMAEALGPLAGKVSSARMRQMNHAVDGEHQAPKDVAAALLKELFP